MTNTDRITELEAENVQLVRELAGQTRSAQNGWRNADAFREAHQQAERERDEARAALDRVKALADEWDADWREDLNVVELHAELRAALEGS